ncbi:uncharacterized protein PODANS_4_6315 [Podospora anserina S mat+]|uniref:Podospora anserina S mat+ genomic DNA chromosome 4, supercontig 4 n=1 Tax=Podospora anserina (strain S / ATCC MYA-4624 / DSM 980 / FGSC 10383) TaxID=515849 RepID=B2APT8_PODAN|nr:uncharacterized protein PODANS_4_6315 [Podospora anserina S mat+]CAP66877.1 unnamed protein product [Podospora anserina S mat+]CDP28619.1 Putative protein of unknown function [Podospora anserina S mat+]
MMIFESEEPDPEPQDAVDCSIALNNILFNRLQSVRERVRTFAVEKAAMEINLEHDNSGEYHRLLYAYNELALELDLEEGLSSAYLQEDVDRYIPHSLFGALSLVIRRKDLGSRGLAACPAANIPVWIHAIHTTLSRALKFIFSLSAHENAAFGQQPDPYLATQHPRRLPDWRNEYLTLAQDLKRELGGYDGFSPADLPPGPSSTWVENITPDKLAAHWFAKEQKYIRDREEKLRKSLVELMEENASGVVEWRWNKINPEDLEEVCKVAYESRGRCFVYIDTDRHSIWEEHIY